VPRDVDYSRRVHTVSVPELPCFFRTWVPRRGGCMHAAFGYGTARAGRADAACWEASAAPRCGLWWSGLIALARPSQRPQCAVVWRACVPVRGAAVLLRKGDCATNRPGCSCGLATVPMLSQGWVCCGTAKQHVRGGCPANTVTGNTSSRAHAGLTTVAVPGSTRPSGGRASSTPSWTPADTSARRGCRSHAAVPAAGPAPALPCLTPVKSSRLAVPK
jgi:hypothetical protein